MGQIKLVALDLDGTALTSHNEIAESTLRAVAKAQQRGVQFTVCTGRFSVSATEMSDRMGLVTPVVSVNGAHILLPRTGETLMAHMMTYEQMRRCVLLAEELGIYFCVFHPEGIFSCQVRYITARYMERARNYAGAYRINVTIADGIPELLERLQDGALKVILSAEQPERLAKARRRLEGEDFEITSSWHDNLEIMAKGVNKGRGLAFVADHLGIGREAVMAIGDNENDLPMLEYAGLGIAMGNAEEAVKARADAVTAGNLEDGVALAIGKYCLGEG